MTGIEQLAVLAAEYLTSETVVSAVAAGAAGAAVSSALAPSPPGIIPPKPMPDQRAVDTARRRSLQEQVQRRGRASTILTDSGDTLG